MKNLIGILALVSTGLTYAQDAVATGSSDVGLRAIAAGIAISVAAVGGGIGQGLAASSALDGIARNPAADKKIFTPFIIAMALIESLVILGFVVAMIIKP